MYSKIKQNANELLNSIKTMPDEIKYINEQHKNIKEIVNKSTEKIEKKRKILNSNLDDFGKYKLLVITNIISDFKKVLDNLKNIENSSIKFNIDKNKELLKKIDSNVINTASVILKDSTKAASSGAFIAAASFGTVSLLGTASSGTAIGALSGIASTNATLAWFGGGALAAGGGGMALGAITLGGLVIVPTIAYMIYKGTFSISKRKEDVEMQLKSALEYQSNTSNILKELSILDKNIIIVLKLLREYIDISLIYEEQTFNILRHKGNDYSKYSDLQRELIDKHIDIIASLIGLLEIQLLNEGNEVNIINVESFKDTIVKNNISRVIDFKDKSIWTKIKDYIFRR